MESTRRNRRAAVLLLLWFAGVGAIWWLQHWRPQQRVEEAVALLRRGHLEDAEASLSVAEEAWFPVPGLDEAWGLRDEVVARRHLKQAGYALNRWELDVARRELDAATERAPHLAAVAEAEAEYVEAEEAFAPLRSAREGLETWRLEGIPADLERALSTGVDPVAVAEASVHLEVAREGEAAVRRAAALLRGARIHEALLTIEQVIPRVAPTHPEVGPLREDARKAVAESLRRAREEGREDEVAWWEACAENTVEAFGRFLADHSESERSGDARAALLHRARTVTAHGGGEEFEHAALQAFTAAGLSRSGEESVLEVTCHADWTPLGTTYSVFRDIGAQYYSTGWKVEGTLAVAVRGAVLHESSFKADTGIPEEVIVVDFQPQGYPKERALDEAGVLNLLESLASHAETADNLTRVDDLLQVLEQGGAGDLGAAADALLCFPSVATATKLVDIMVAATDSGSRERMAAIHRALVGMGHHAVPPLTVVLVSGGRSSAALKRERDAVERAILVLGDVGDPSAVPAILPHIRGCRDAAVAALVEIGPACVPALLSELEREEFRSHRAVIEALQRIGDSRAADSLIRLLDDASELVRADAMNALGELADPRAVEPLIARLENVKALNTLVRIGEPAVVPLIDALSTQTAASQRNVIRALGILGDSRAVDELIGLIDEGRFVSDVIRALASIGDRRATVPLLEVLKSGTHTFEVLGALGSLGDRRAVEPVIELLADPAPSIRERAVEALAELGDPAALEAVSALLEDENSSVRRAAEVGVRKLR